MNYELRGKEVVEIVFSLQRFIGRLIETEDFRALGFRRWDLVGNLNVDGDSCLL